MKWKKLSSFSHEVRAWQTRVDSRRYTIYEISPRDGDLYVLDVFPSAWGYEVFVDRDGNETDVRTSRASFQSKAEAVRAARKHAQRSSR